MIIGNLGGVGTEQLVADDDGDEEDLEAHEVDEALRAFDLHQRRTQMEKEERQESRTVPQSRALGGGGGFMGNGSGATVGAASTSASASGRPLSSSDRSGSAMDEGAEVHRPRLLLHGEHGMGQMHIGAALLHELEEFMMCFLSLTLSPLSI